MNKHPLYDHMNNILSTDFEDWDRPHIVRVEPKSIRVNDYCILAIAALVCVLFIIGVI